MSIFSIPYKFMRKIALKILERVNPGDIHIRHHYTQDKIKLHSFRHKGYWFHGKNRERATTDRFSEIISADDVVIEVGGHIGYMSLLFSQLVGEQGSVIVFEPGINNLPYIKYNASLRSNIAIEEFAVCDKIGETTFYLENLTGQNNSLLQDYEVLNRNIAAASIETTRQCVTVQTLTLDHFVETRQICPNFIKIDIEGAEYVALCGATKSLTEMRPALMVEVTENSRQVLELLHSKKYRVFLPSGEEILLTGPNDDRVLGNIFAIPGESSKVGLFLPE